MIDAFKLAELPRDKPLIVKLGNRPRECALHGCPTDQHSYVVRLPNGALACANCADDAGFELDWGRV